MLTNSTPTPWRRPRSGRTARGAGREQDLHAASVLDRNRRAQEESAAPKISRRAIDGGLVALDPTLAAHRVALVAPALVALRRLRRRFLQRDQPHLRIAPIRALCRPSIARG